MEGDLEPFCKALNEDNKTCNIDGSQCPKSEACEVLRAIEDKRDY